MLYALLAVTVPIGVLLAYASTRPDAFRVERSTIISATPETIAAFVDDFHRWTAWSPWEKIDPALKRTYTGPERGVGAIYTWDGSRQVGAGRMEVTSTSAQKIEIKLDFLRPFAASNVAEFTFVPEGGSTRVTWAMHGKSPLMSKVMGVFMDMDAMIGKDFASGLSNLKAAVEA